jgi:hypothetical protein
MLRRLAPFALLVLLWTATAAGQPAASPDPLAAELTLAVRARLDAYARADAAAWGRFVADDCLCGVAGKAGPMQELTTRPAGVHISVGEVGPLEIRMHGDVVVARPCCRSIRPVPTWIPRTTTRSSAVTSTRRALARRSRATA